MSEEIGRFAQELYDQMEMAKRDDDSEYWRVKEEFRGGPITEMIFTVHDGLFPDDYIYEFVVDALGALSDCDGDLDSAREGTEADVYTSRLTAWLHSNNLRMYFMQEVLDEFDGLDAFQQLGYAQHMEREQVLLGVFGWLDENVPDYEEEDENAH
jgi:hypothetical protein